jgi:hypothetical protein
VNWLWFLIGLNAGLALSLFLVVTALALGICLWTQTDGERICIRDEGHDEKHEWEASSRLARIEAWAKFALKNGGPEDKFDDVLALVKVARAAETVWTSIGHAAWCGSIEGEPCDCGQTALREALAVLNKEPA